jgi:hypothetical protein
MSAYIELNTWECPSCSEEHSELPYITATHCRRCGVIVLLSEADEDNRVNAFLTGHRMPEHEEVMTEGETNDEQE